ncbi:restriction endonuclease subunit S [Kiloniella litopenaei]|uniref:restriction endonuclease subunit S n=1 Tax=Kiloniella litopenaei TaxID=1549748 RepID=UPI003BAB3CC2
MKSSYKKLGPYIRETSVKNSDNAIEKLLGVSITKKFIPSIANTVGTDLSKYKIVRKGQFAYGPVTSRNGEKISVALLEEGDCILSTSYTVFELTNKEELDPEYLMMWFRRSEFDRYARYMSHGSVREIFGWEEMCGVELPIPDIETQREIVREYNVIVDRIKLNEQLCTKLEETAQALYKHWFVDFEFPISAEYAASIGKPELEGKPYKSSGGEMKLCSKLDKKLPATWGVGGLHDIAELIDGDRGSNYPSKTEYQEDGHCLFLSTSNVTKTGFLFDENNFISKERDSALRKGKLIRGDIVLTTRGTVGNSAYYSKLIEYDHMRINSGMIIVRGHSNAEYSPYIYVRLNSTEMAQAIGTFLSGSAQQHLPIRDIKVIPLPLPEESTIQFANNKLRTIVSHIDHLRKDIRSLKVSSHVLLALMTKSERLAA